MRNPKKMEKPQRMRHPIGGKVGRGGREKDRETDIERQRQRDTQRDKRLRMAKELLDM